MKKRVAKKKPAKKKQASRVSPHAIPKGWRRVIGTVTKYDWIKSPYGWEPAANLGPSVFTKDGIRSAAGHPTALYECVIGTVECECPECDGSGKEWCAAYKGESCNVCDGSGRVYPGNPMDKTVMRPA